MNMENWEKWEAYGPEGDGFIEKFFDMTPPIEITAKQLYEIYKSLPNVNSAYMENRWHYNAPFGLQDICFEIDFSYNELEWKPTTDLIIKA